MKHRKGLYTAKKVSGFWSSVGLKIGTVACFCLFFANREIRDTYIVSSGTTFPMQSMVAKRGLTNHANVHTHMWKSRLKHSTAEFQSIPAILAAIVHCFIAPQKRKLKMQTCAWRLFWGLTVYTEHAWKCCSVTVLNVSIKRLPMNASRTKPYSYQNIQSSHRLQQGLTKCDLSHNVNGFPRTE